MFDFHRALANAVRWLYLAGLSLSLFTYFSGQELDIPVVLLALSGALSLAVILHEYLQQRLVRIIWSRKSQEGLDEKKQKFYTKQLWVNGGILGFLTVFNVFNLINRMALTTWHHNMLPVEAQIIVQGASLAILWLLSSLLVEAEEDAVAILARNATQMQKETTQQTSVQWKARIKRALENGINLAPIAAALMEDAGNVDNAKRISMIDKALTQAEQSRPHNALSAKSGKSINLYSASAQAQPGAKPMQFPTQTVDKVPDEIQGKRKPRKAIPRTAKARIYRILDRMENPVGTELTELARAAKCDWKTARKHYLQWLEDHSIRLAEIS